MPDTKQERSAFEKLIADPHKAGCAICAYLVCPELREKCRVWDAALQAACEAGDKVIDHLRQQCKVLNENDAVCMAMDVGEQIRGAMAYSEAIRALLSKPEGKR